MIMVFCVGIASASNIIIISDTGYWPAGASQMEFDDWNNTWVNSGGETPCFQDSQLVDYLKSLGHTVDTSGMAGNYRDARPAWTSDSAKVAALNNADLIIISRNISASQYVKRYIKGRHWNELTVPILCQCANMLQYNEGYSWLGWFNGGVAQQDGGSFDMNLEMGHDLVSGFYDPIAVFSDIPANPQNPLSDAVWDSRTNVIATYEGATMMADIPAGTDLDVLCETTSTGDKGVTGARRIYMGIYTYDGSTWGAGLTNAYKELFAQVVSRATSPVKLTNISPVNKTTGVSADYMDTEDLVFDVLESSVSAVDFYFGTDPNVTENSANLLIENMPISATGQYTIDLATELTENLTFEEQYYWTAVGYEPNSVTGTTEPVVKGPVWSFTVEPARPILSAVTPGQIIVFPAEPTVVFSVTGSNVEHYQWYKEGVAAPLPEGSDYSGVTTDTLTIYDIDENDIGNYYCVGSKTGFTDATSEPSGQLQFKELKHYFPFNVEDTAGDITPDVIGGAEGQLFGGASVEYNEPNAIYGGYLLLENMGDNAADSEFMQILDQDVADYVDITISAWFNQGIRDIGCLWDFGEDEHNFFTFTPGYRDDIVKTQFEYIIEEEQKQAEYEVGFNRNDNWQFVVVTIDSTGNSKTYIDGEFKASASLRGEDVTEVNLTYINKPYNYIGQRNYPNTPKFDGFIDEIKIFNYVLTDAQVAQEYLSVKGGTVICTSEYDLQDYDYDHNCRVDILDFAEFATRWLDDNRFYRP